MSLIPSSKRTTVLVALVIAVAAVGTAAAVTVDKTSAPKEAQVGSEVTAEVTLTELYNQTDQWTLRGTTQLNNVTSWTVTKRFSNGTTREETFTGQQQFEVSIKKSNNFESITISVSGDAPPVSKYTYRPPQKFNAMKLVKAVGDGQTAITTVKVHHYTNESQQARKAIREAEKTVNNSDSAEAENRLQQAISAFNSENFDNAESIAKDAKKTANQAKQSEGTMTLVLYGVGAIVVLALIGGGIYYFRGEQDSYDKLR